MSMSQAILFYFYGTDTRLATIICFVQFIDALHKKNIFRSIKAHFISKRGQLCGLPPLSGLNLWFTFVSLVLNQKLK